MFARTPVFRTDQGIYGYALHFHPEPGAIGPAACPLQAWSGVFPFDAFADRRLLLRATPELIPPLLSSPMLEPARRGHALLELVTPPADGLEAEFSRLRSQGYGILLDERQLDAGSGALELADVVRAALPPENVRELPARLRALADGGRTLLAADVPSHEAQQRAARLGFGLFQGEYFCRPPAIPVTDLPRSKASYVLFLVELAKPDLDLARIERIVKGEPSLVVRLMRYLNSPIFGVRSPITSVRHALTYLGEKPLRRWGSVLAVTGMSEDRPGELVVTALVRARLCEELGKLEDRRNAETYFLTGLLSPIDAMLGRPALTCLYELPLDDAIRRAILGEDNPLGRALKTAMAFERADWARQASLPGSCGDATRLHCEVLRWAQEIVAAGAAA
ncbi:MAG TPA: HDOD domain-containing protein [Planctomycetota bacterium]